MALDPARRSLLLAAKLRALVRAAGHEPTGDAWAPPGAAAVRTDDGRRWLLGDAPEGLGGLLLAIGRDPAPAVVVVDGDDAALAATTLVVAALARPVAVARVEGTTVGEPSPVDLVRAVASTPLPLPEPAPVSDVPLDPEDEEVVGTVLAGALARHPHLARRDTDAGPTLLLRGLDVARVVAVEGRLFVDVGVSERDRQAARGMVGDQPAALLGAERLTAEIDRVVEVIDLRRASAAEPHPLRRYHLERWLCDAVAADPGLAGLPADVSLRIASDPPEDGPAVAVGDGCVVACAAGVHLDVVPRAVRAWAVHARRAGEPAAWPSLTIAVPARDAYAVQHELVDALAPELGARLAAVADGWERATDPSASAR